MKIELYKTKSMFRRAEWKWRLRADNGEIICNSTEGYINRLDAENGINLARLAMPRARVVSV